MAEIGHNGITGSKLRLFLERVERIREEKRALAADEAAVFAEAKSDGFDPAAMKRALKRRGMKPNDLADMEAIDDLYMSAIGMKKEAPLFRHVGLMGVDIHARDQVVEALKQLVPPNGEMIVKTPAGAVRIWRDDEGAAHGEDYVEPAAAQRTETPKAQRGGRAERPPPPDVDGAGAKALGRQAAKDNEPVIANPFPFGDERRPLWDEGWREEAGSDGMGPRPDRKGGGEA